MNLLSCSLQVHNCPRVLLVLTWHADLAPQNTSWLRHFIKRHQHHHLHHLLASGLRDLHGGVHGQGMVVASSGGAHAVAERVRHAHPQRDATARESRGLERERGPSAMSPSLSIGARRSCRAEPGTSVSTSATDSSDGDGGGKKRSVRKVMSSTSDGAAHGIARCPEASLQQGHGVDVLVGVGVEGRRPRSCPTSRRARLPAEWQGQGR